MRRTWAGCLITVVVLVAACSSGDDGEEGEARSGTVAESGSETGSETAAAPVRVLTMNVLHGRFCPPETDSCQAPDRVQIFTELVEAADCPDLIGLQEIGTRMEELLVPMVDVMCDGEYSIEWQGQPDPERQMVLTRLPVVDSGHLDIANFPWEAYWVRVDSDQGPVDFLTAHFASVLGNNPPCSADVCPPICPDGIVTNECHAIEVVDFSAGRDPAALTIASGDFNARPGTPTLQTFLDAGFIDAWLEAGNPECDPTTHRGCTAGGFEPPPFVGIDTRQGPGFSARIDFVLVRPGEDCSLEVASEGFAVEARAEPLNGLWWPADHGGVLAELSC